MRATSLIACGAAFALLPFTAPAASANSSSVPDPTLVTKTVEVPAPTAENLALGARTDGRAVVVIEGGGSPHPYTTPWDACDGGRPTFIQSMVDSGLAVFTAPGKGNTLPSAAGRTGCPPQPPLDIQWNTSGYPTQAGEAVLGFLGYLNATYGYRTFDLVGYSYGGLVSRATIAALKRPPAADSLAPSFSYANVALQAGITIPTLVTLNSPHLGAPAYDIASDPRKFLPRVTKGWGKPYAEAAKGLIVFERTGGAGAIHVLRTQSHSRDNPNSWDASQVGVLDDVAVTLIGGDYCGRTCGVDRLADSPSGRPYPRTDGTVPLYSQLIQPCGKGCGNPPGPVYIPPGMVPEGTVRKVFPTMHSTFDADRRGLPSELSVSKNPGAIDYLVTTVTAPWRALGVPLNAQG